MESLNAYQIIQKKRDGIALTDSEIQWFIQGLTLGEVADYQMTALLMAIFINGMNTQETQALTEAMLHSGKVLKFDDPTVIDKHSTGGIGDKASFVIAPLAAACGVKVPMIAGRGLGHTGGTVDKVESIEGFNTNINLQQFSELLKKHGLVLTGQTREIAPADKKIYALRDVTATINSIPLITASIMSKKLAEGISGLVMDLKFGSGAFMKSKSSCRKLAKSMMKVASKFNVNSMMFITNMDWPLGNMVGHSHEVIECIETLKGRGPKDLEQLSLSLAGGMIYLAGLAKSHKQGIAKAKKALDSGEALKKFTQLIKDQGGDPKVITDYKRLPQALKTYTVKAQKSGYIKSFQNDQIGFLLLELGGGRKRTADKFDFSVGLEFHKKPGAKIKAGDEIFSIFHHASQLNLVKELESKFNNEIIKYSKTKPKLDPLIYEALES